MSGVGLGRSGRRGKDRLALTTDINVASLVDVAFTLLIIFIISAPILQGGMDVNLPQAGATPVAATENMFIVTIQADDRVFLEQTELPIDDLATMLPQLLTTGGTEKMFIKADSAASMGIFTRLLEVASAAGVPATIIVEPRPIPRNR